MDYLKERALLERLFWYVQPYIGGLLHYQSKSNE